MERARTTELEEAREFLCDDEDQQRKLTELWGVSTKT